MILANFWLILAKVINKIKQVSSSPALHFKVLVESASFHKEIQCGESFARLAVPEAHCSQGLPLWMSYIWRKSAFQTGVDLHNKCQRIPHMVKVSGNSLLSPFLFFSLLFFFFSFFPVLHMGVHGFRLQLCLFRWVQTNISASSWTWGCVSQILAGCVSISLVQCCCWDDSFFLPAGFIHSEHAVAPGMQQGSVYSAQTPGKVWTTACAHSCGYNLWAFVCRDLISCLRWVPMTAAHWGAIDYRHMLEMTSYTPVLWRPSQPQFYIKFPQQIAVL